MLNRILSIVHFNKATSYLARSDFWINWSIGSVFNSILPSLIFFYFFFIRSTVSIYLNLILVSRFFRSLGLFTFFDSVALGVLFFILLLFLFTVLLLL